jgi:hypothetical protein
MKSIFINFFIVAFLVLISCKKENLKEDYYIISKQDSINKTFQYTKDSTKIPPPPLPPVDLKWYSNLVFIMDSKNKVYVYQTENINKYIQNGNAIIYDIEYPNYIGLKPEHLLTFESEDFIKFIQTNNDIFQLYSNTENRTNRFFYIVSDCDTVKNKAVYEFVKSFKNEPRINYLIRKSTEEENIVLKFKRNGQKYIPENINWSTKFLNGKLKPFTEEYKNTESRIHSTREAKETYKKNGTEIFITM